MYHDDTADPPAVVCQVGSTTLSYDVPAIEDLHGWLVEQGDWVQLGAADEKKKPTSGTVEAWGRSPESPVGGWYGLRRGYRGRFAMYLSPLLETLGLAEVTHQAVGDYHDLDGSETVLLTEPAKGGQPQRRRCPRDRTQATPS